MFSQLIIFNMNNKVSNTKYIKKVNKIKKNKRKQKNENKNQIKIDFC